MKGMVKAIITGCVFIGIGIVVLLLALGLNGWSFTPNYEMTDYTAETTEIATVELQFNAGKLKTEFYDGEYITVKYPKIENFKTNIIVENGAFKFSGPNKLHWYSFPLGWGKLPETTIKLPKSSTFNLDLQVNAGAVDIAQGTYGTVKIQLNAGAITVNGETECSAFNCTVNAGSATIDNMNCSGLFDCNVNAGSITVKNLICDNIVTEVNAGSLKLKIDGKKADYTITVDKSAGSCDVVNQTGTGGKTLKVDVSAGSVTVEFTS